MARGSPGPDAGKDKTYFDQRVKLTITAPGAVVLPISRKGSIRLDPNIQSIVNELIEQLAPTVGHAFDAHFMPYAERIYDTWPVKSGHSRGLLSVEYDVRGGGAELVAFIESGAKYTRWIHRGKQVRHMFSEGRKAAEAVADELGKGLT